VYLTSFGYSAMRDKFLQCARNEPQGRVAVMYRGPTPLRPVAQFFYRVSKFLMLHNVTALSHATHSREQCALNDVSSSFDYLLKIFFTVSTFAKKKNSTLFSENIHDFVTMRKRV
jgi:hypothetical protein